VHHRSPSNFPCASFALLHVTGKAKLIYHHGLYPQAGDVSSLSIAFQKSTWALLFLSWSKAGQKLDKRWTKDGQKVDRDATSSRMQISNFKMQNGGTDTKRSGRASDVWGKKVGQNPGVPAKARSDFVG